MIAEQDVVILKVESFVCIHLVVHAGFREAVCTAAYIVK